MAGERVLFGRTKIYTNVPVITPQNVVEVLNDVLPVHFQNATEIDYLYKYYRGRQPILDRTKTIRPEICNKIIENRANEIVAFKTGYLCGEPIQYVSRGTGGSVNDGISELNSQMMLCGKAARDKEIVEWGYIAGVGCRMALPNRAKIKGNAIDEAAFFTYTLDPRGAFVVYYSGLGEPPVMGVKIVTLKDDTFLYSVYTPTWYFEVQNDQNSKKRATAPLAMSNRGISNEQCPSWGLRNGSLDTGCHK